MVKNRIKLNICGCECVVGSDDSENYIRSIGDEVQKAIDGIMEKNGKVSVTNLRSQIKDYLEDSSRARTESEESRREIERLKREVQTLRSRLGESAEDGDKRPPVAPGAAVQHPQTGSYSRVKPNADPSLQEGFMSFFEKKTDEP